MENTFYQSPGFLELDGIDDMSIFFVEPRGGDETAVANVAIQPLPPTFSTPTAEFNSVEFIRASTVAPFQRPNEPLNNNLNINDIASITIPITVFRIDGHQRTLAFVPDIIDSIAQFFGVTQPDRALERNVTDSDLERFKPFLIPKERLGAAAKPIGKRKKNQRFVVDVVGDVAAAVFTTFHGRRQRTVHLPMGASPAGAPQPGPQQSSAMIQVPQGSAPIHVPFVDIPAIADPRSVAVPTRRLNITNSAKSPAEVVGDMRVSSRQPVRKTESRDSHEEGMRPAKRQRTGDGLQGQNDGQLRRAVEAMLDGNTHVINITNGVKSPAFVGGDFIVDSSSSDATD